MKFGLVFRLGQVGESWIGGEKNRGDRWSRGLVWSGEVCLKESCLR